uniref:Uncharacterized protein n=1 Tax=Eutreptiella gymnastica TaxID=73025 RepID=A0A6T2I6F5_9EUGL|eukprot:CAMPEP_0174304030 /NCGR_PEP_ID=MMETSP0809-20121228/60528_1 /TAXON_ID=73025 ORGANISM="Eutreptiella gymnastica-like, Strain CCMP1594" /NCGR_SAMPLE_ID=MMETSP0809 /ASSEMBLY_ACC=CAM_ASM_000658 /LENGTH=134 /DNA_ID=CAMNT_0015410171 /DNA_START=4525 /DNA_END=4929 /DNA_ORIENTATION=-
MMLRDMGYGSGRDSRAPKSKAKPGSHPESQPMKPLLRRGIGHSDQMHAPRSRQAECLCQNATANRSHQRVGLCSQPQARPEVACPKAGKGPTTANACARATDGLASHFTVRGRIAILCVREASTTGRLPQLQAL